MIRYTQKLVWAACIVTVFCLCLTVFDGAALAAEATGEGGGYLSSYQDPAQQSTGSSLLSTIAYVITMVIAFGVVLALAYFASRLLGHKFGAYAPTKSSKVLESLPLGTNKSLYVVEIAGKVVVIGVTDHNITLLKEITDEMEIARLKVQAESEYNHDTFNRVFEKQMISLEQLSRNFPNLFGNKERK